LMGPRQVWLRLFTLLECWCRVHLHRPVRYFPMVREAVVSDFPANSKGVDHDTVAGGRT
jgi:hypothetical protein